ncbi:MAG TPA: cytochrome c oxidase subunit 3 [Bryobacteraceae bacterium]|nr:cytochrome c oxidase subunit 3 [Bryobacteraceae bacterium]
MKLFRREPRFSWSAYQIGMMVALLSITVFFAALIIAYSVSVRAQSQWQRIDVPKLLWVSTGILLFSSATFEASRFALRRARFDSFQSGVRLTMLLGIAFLVSQLLSWDVLRRAGVYVQQNPHGSMFYAFTGAHGVHLFGGICGVGYVLHHGRNLEAWTEHQLRRFRAIVGVVSVYWHFMGALWAVLFVLLYVWSY